MRLIQKTTGLTSGGTPRAACGIMMGMIGSDVTRRRRKGGSCIEEPKAGNTLSGTGSEIVMIRPDRADATAATGDPGPALPGPPLGAKKSRRTGCKTAREERYFHDRNGMAIARLLGVWAVAWSTIDSTEVLKKS